MTDTPIRIFVGTDANGGCAEAQMVYEHSLRKRSSLPIELHWMKISKDPNSFWYGWNTDRWSTPFSGFRYGIAAACDFKGKAIYTDDDMVWLHDPAELWNMEIPDDKIMTGKKLRNGEIRHCVSLIDCAKWEDFPPVQRRKGNDDFVETMKRLTIPMTHIIDDAWNCYDGEDKNIEDIKLLHLTAMSSNPAIALAVRRLGDQSKHWYDGPIVPHRRRDIVELFIKEYEDALADGYSVADYIPNELVDYTKQSQVGYKANNGWD